MSFLHYDNELGLPSEIINGNVYYTKDKQIFVDDEGQRKKLNVKFFSLLYDKFLELIESTEEVPNKYSFAFISDTHETPSGQSLMQAINNSGVNLLIHGGDYVDYNTDSTGNTVANQVSIYSQIENYLITRGNHDSTVGSSYNQFLTEEQTKIAMTKDPPYYFHDIPEKKLRFIVLNAHDRNTNSTINADPQHYYGYSLEQMKWLCGTALQVSEPGWSAILISHTPIAPLEQMEGWSNLLYNERYGGGLGRWYIASKVISACNNATSLTYPYREGDIGSNAMNYSFNGNIKIIAALCGHVHADNILNVNGVPNISIEAASESPCFDYITVDLSNQTIVLDRYNALGEKQSSREATWTSPTGENIGTEYYSSSPVGTNYNCIVFDKIDPVNYGIKYIAIDRTSANQQTYLADVSDETITIDLNGSNQVTFINGKLGTYTGNYTTRAVDGNTFKIYFSNGYYTGWSNSSASSATNTPSGPNNDFFGVQNNTY